jgi:Mn2+/Fe2+ NRAMP family transporter
VVFNFSPIDPIRALLWSAVINGVVAVPITAVMMLAADSKVMGQFKITGPPRAHRPATIVMVAAALGRGITAILRISGLSTT